MDMVMPLKPDEWPFATDEDRAAGWRESRFDRRRARRAASTDAALRAVTELHSRYNGWSRMDPGDPDANPVWLCEVDDESYPCRTVLLAKLPPAPEAEPT